MNFANSVFPRVDGSMEAQCSDSRPRQFPAHANGNANVRLKEARSLSIPSPDSQQNPVLVLEAFFAMAAPFHIFPFELKFDGMEFRLHERGRLAKALCGYVSGAALFVAVHSFVHFLISQQVKDGYVVWYFDVVTLAGGVVYYV